MSYRTYINDVQVFGNNEYYPEWIEYLEKQGIEIGVDGDYEGEITNFMEALDVVESIVIRLESERREKLRQFNEDCKKKSVTDEERKILEESVFGIKSIFDLRHIYDDVVNDNETSLLDKEFHYLECGYMFMPYAFFKACENKLERAGHKFKSKHFYNFKIKEGETISVSAG